MAAREFGDLNLFFCTLNNKPPNYHSLPGGHVPVINPYDTTLPPTPMWNLRFHLLQHSHYPALNAGIIKKDMYWLILNELPCLSNSKRPSSKKNEFQNIDIDIDKAPNNKINTLLKYTTHKVTKGVQGQSAWKSCFQTHRKNEQRRSRTELPKGGMPPYDMGCCSQQHSLTVACGDWSGQMMPRSYAMHSCLDRANGLQLLGKFNACPFS